MSGGMRKQSQKSVADESVRPREVAGVEGQGVGVEEVKGVAGGDEAVGDGGVEVKTGEDELSLNLSEV